MIDWKSYFERERQIEQLAFRAGLANPRGVAARLNERLIRPLPPTLAARLLLLAARRVRNCLTKEHHHE
jgi:hypothetical protein